MNAHNKASEWFDGLYREHEKSQENIPWARQAVNPWLQSYLDEVLSHRGKALVIGCGLGDDAYALELAGYDVTAIDVSESALMQAKKRFPNSRVSFEKQDIFEYEETFDFVFEAFTIQSLPLEFRQQMIEVIANRVKNEGYLLLVAHQQEHKFDGPPWPLTLEDIQAFEKYELIEHSRNIYQEKSRISNTRFRVLYKREKK